VLEQRLARQNIKPTPSMREAVPEKYASTSE